MPCSTRPWSTNSPRSAEGADIAIGVVERKAARPLPEDAADVAQVSRRAPTPGQTCSRSSSQRCGRRSSCGGGRTGPQEGLAADRRCSGRGAAARCALKLRQPRRKCCRARAQARLRIRTAVSCPTRWPGSTSTNRPTTRWSKRSSRGAHERPGGLRHGPDGHAARDLHAVPAALRNPPRAVAAAVPAARRAVDARLWARLIDRARLKEINHHLLLGDDDPPARPQAAGRELRRQADRHEHPAGRARRHCARQGRRAPAGAGDRLLPALRRRDRASGWASTT